MNSELILSIKEKLKKDKKLLSALLVGILGLLLILFSQIGGEEKTVDTKQQDNIVLTESELSQKLEDIIEAIDGAGKCKSMITYDGSCETVYAADISEDDNQRESEYIIIDSSGDEDGLKIKIIYPKIKGVAIVCQGGGNPVIKEQIISTVSALFDISSNKISVAQMAK